MQMRPCYRTDGGLSPYPVPVPVSIPWISVSDGADYRTLSPWREAGPIRSRQSRQQRRYYRTTGGYHPRFSRAGVPYPLLDPAYMPHFWDLCVVLRNLCHFPAKKCPHNPRSSQHLRAYAKIVPTRGHLTLANRYTLRVKWKGVVFLQSSVAHAAASRATPPLTAPKRAGIIGRYVMSPAITHNCAHRADPGAPEMTRMLCEDYRRAGLDTIPTGPSKPRPCPPLGPIAQLDGAPDCRSEGRGFKSRWGRLGLRFESARARCRYLDIETRVWGRPALGEGRGQWCPTGLENQPSLDRLTVRFRYLPFTV